jgi:hypothetical protein
VARKFAVDLDLLSAFAIRNALLNPVTNDPSGLGVGQAGLVWFNTTSGRLKVWSGSAAVDFLDRANHVGTQLASTISDLVATVTALRLDQFAAPNTDVSFGSHKATNLLDPTTNQDAATKAYVDNALAGLASGQVIKGAVAVAATANVDTAAPGAAIDGQTISNGEVVLLTGQTTASQNGPWVFNGSAAAMTRATNWDTTAEAALGSYWVVQRGTKADNYALLTNDTAITLGTTALVFTFIGGTTLTQGNGVTISSGIVSVLASPGGGLAVDGTGVKLDTAVAVRKVTGIIPTATSGIFTVSGAVVTINHQLNNSAATIIVRAGSSPAAGYTTGQRVELDDPTTDANNLQVTLPGVPAANNWTFMIEG